MGPVTLGVADLARSIAFYETAIGLAVRDRHGERAELGIEERPLLRLVERAGGRPAPSAPGLFHFALLVPRRRELGRALVHLVESRVPLDGAADHLVSEAVYLSDPDGHGIEIYRDRPQREWSYDGDGRLQMATLPLDTEGVLTSAEHDGGPYELAPGTRMGHVHLRVSALQEAARFFEDAIGMSTMTTMPGALFLASDGYHHHIGANVWHSRGGSPRPAGSLGLERFEVVASDGAVRAATARARDRGYPVAEADGAASLTGMDEIVCDLTSASARPGGRHG
jgi:catechol 2,3-dioxygenase